jgi:5-methylcytosine-specific restriction endonuclease McrA
MESDEMRRTLAKDPSRMTKKEIYNDPRYQAARRACLRRAGFMCEECRRYGRNTTATMTHHIKPVEEYPELAFSAANLRALCAACHNKEHPEKGGTRGYRK